MYRTPFCTAIVVLLVVLAGCGGVGPGTDDGDTPGGVTDSTDVGTTPADGTDGGAVTDDRTATDGGDGSPPEVTFFEFDRPGRYVYEATVPSHGTGQVVWDIQDVEGEEISLAFDYDVGNVSYQTNVTGTADVIQSQLMQSPAGMFAMLSIHPPLLSQYQGEALEVGREWSYSSPEGSLRFAITGMDTQAGVECYVSVIERNGTLIHEACFSPDLGLTPYYAWYDEDTGEIQVLMRLLEYTPID